MTLPLGTNKRPSSRSIEAKIGLVLWSGRVVGGAETFTSGLAAAMRRQGADASVLFIGQPGEVGRRLDGEGVPHSSLGLAPGARVLLSPRGFARELARAAPDGAVLVSAGYLAAAARIGGYRPRIAAVEHGSILQHERLPPVRRVIRSVDRLSGVRAVDVQVAVSDYVRERVLRSPHAREVIRIHNALDLAYFRSAPMPPGRRLIIGCAARLIPGKGLEYLIDAVRLMPRGRVRLHIAGVGSELDHLQRLANSAGISDDVRFLGLVSDMRLFWAQCHVAAVPSCEWIESFGMVACEAMATARPVVGTQNGALPEVIEDGRTGRIVEPGNAEALAAAIVEYEQRDLCSEEGAAARERCERLFDLAGCADAYLTLFR